MIDDWLEERDGIIFAIMNAGPQVTRTGTNGPVSVGECWVNKKDTNNGQIFEVIAINGFKVVVKSKISNKVRQMNHSSLWDKYRRM